METPPPTLLQTAQSLVTITGTCVAMYVGLSGLSTWRRQLHGTNQFAMGTKLLLLANQIREAIINERNNPVNCTWLDGPPAADAENIKRIEGLLGTESHYLEELINTSRTFQRELLDTTVLVDGHLPIDVKEICQDLLRCVQKWKEALKARSKNLEHCSTFRRYETLVGWENVDAILVRDQNRQESLQFEVELRNAALKIAKAMQPFIKGTM